MRCVAYTILIAALVQIVWCQVPNLGFCPGYVPMAEFNINRFLGKWYEAERYFTFTEVGSRCVTTHYARGPNNKIFVANKITNRITGVKRVIDGELNELGKAGEGKLTVRYNVLPVPYDTSYVVLDTDYDSYAVLWACSGIGPIHTQNAWVMTRERLPAGSILQKAYGVLDKYKISRAFFVKTDQETCALTADDITENEQQLVENDEEALRSAGGPESNSVPESINKPVLPPQILLAKLPTKIEPAPADNLPKTDPVPSITETKI